MTKPASYELSVFVRGLPVILLAILLVSIGSFGLSRAHADEGEEASWIVSHQVEGNLVVTPDSSLEQWQAAHHGTAHSLDEVEMEVMSVHNETYIVFLIERPFNLSISQAGAAVFINGTAFDSWNAVWGWAGGAENSTDPRVESSGVLNGEALTVVFGRALVPLTGLEAVLSIGEPYDEAVKVTSWNDGTAPTTLDFSEVQASGLELLAPIDLYPRTPFVYGAVILLGSFGFILLEVRRHRR